METTAPSQRILPSAVGDSTADTAGIAERRESPRQPCESPIWWKGSDDERFRQGWLVEQSGDGAAFLTRGQMSLLEGTRIETSTSDPTDIGFVVRDGFVKRIVHVHGDLNLVAAQLRPLDQ